MNSNQTIDLNTIMSYMILMMVIVMMMRVTTKAVEPAKPREVRKLYPGKLPPGYKPLHHSSERQYGEPRSEAERAEVHEELYGTEELPPRGSGLAERGESAEGRRLGEPKTREERRETHKGLYGGSELPERGGGLHYSIHGPERQKLVDQYGSWATGRAESVCPEGDVECVEREASRLLGAHRRAYTTGGKGYYWSITVDTTEERVEYGQPYTSTRRAVIGARAHIRKAVREGEWLAESTYTVKILRVSPFEVPVDERTEENIALTTTLRGSEIV